MKSKSPSARYRLADLHGFAYKLSIAGVSIPIMKEIKLTKGQVALVDDEDFERINQYKWCANKRPGTWYATRKSISNRIRKTVSMHREIMGEIIGGEFYIDHRDCNGLNNQKSNLRQATNSQNQQNQRKRTTPTSSRYKGVCWYSPKRRWRATVNTKTLGLFRSEEDAARAYDKAAKILFGEFARLNFP